ncbi:MAG: methionine biosynthesis protein MetW [Burkholderiales bacterium]|jgi:methionine biosynthesis protein MetW|nr:methionine biosynthesis protein MetW [Burkholderiales bacterium]MCA3154069.1 methionine biosynthesis protein MetW [Burkholderiales bacterium]MCA3156722.1 methionine biosynthesis protein MetW [Burkholderiales bacterium]MCA3159214.1 methionine biosynthesis protein MetW [Burkholderiales bacterium]MCA3161013.1 methionine biosynthesis protein MetW [Burkholderiales bacterium]
MTDSEHLRRDLEFIARWIAPGSHVLDLGCGDGTLLRHVREHKHCTGYGVEISDEKVLACIKNGIHVLQQDINNGLALFDNDAFDTVVLLETLPAIRHVETTLREMARVGREIIVSFPNFGHWHHRWALLQGRMPVSESLPYEWYDTPNVRFATLYDFEVLAAKVGLQILDRLAFDQGRAIHFLPNWFGTLGVFRLRKA